MLSIHRGRRARVAARVVVAGTISWLVGCSGDADSHEPRARALASLQSPYLEETKIGNRSGTKDDAISAAGCFPDQTLTGCDCYSPWASCDGAYAEGNLCRAFNKASGKGVYAVAQCITFDGKQVPPIVRESEKSGTSASSFATVTCDDGWTLTGCSCYSPWASCEGASIVGSNTCRADNKAGGHGVYAEAICLELGETNPLPVLGPISGTANDAPASVSCPEDHILTGCTCASTNASCDGAQVIDLDCVAFNKGGGSGVKPQAMCVQVAGCHGACGGPSPDGCACDPGCKARGDCCQNYELLCEAQSFGGFGGSGGSGG